MNFRIFISTIAAALASIASATDLSQYMPSINGAIRTRWEMDTESGQGRFQVRFARLILNGKIAPSVGYFFQTDLCDKGKMKILDAYGRLGIINGLSFQAGQFRMPFGIESFRSPRNYLFANRSFMGKYMCNYRRVGAKLTYDLPTTCPLTLEAGVFNSGAMSSHDEWNKTYSYATKAVLTLGQFKLATGAMSVSPETVRMFMYDGAVSWQNSHFIIAAEYMNEHYGSHARSDAHSYCAYIDYHKPVKAGIFNQWSVQGRFDGMTSQWSGQESSETLPQRKRITVGSTLTYTHKSVFTDIRLNYEKYFYHSGTDVAIGDGDKIVAEFVVRF
ncbi:MAG: OprO/OprP family phosphate-selective porin [Muribaculum sp.]|nr:OprO/OprP family phosphate-selective porin [Muribaculaceae bacterium]MCM1081243.1 OprO/OprP family phosphate-selective porin [Muribaculum sp.]